jgi:AcrR family transcriptional regulator
MSQPSDKAAQNPRAGRRRCPAKAERIEMITCAAGKLFLRDGYAQASVARIAAEAGVSTRTIYAHYNNKAALFEAVIGRFLNRKGAAPATADLDQLEPRAALMVFANKLMARARDSNSAALFRLVATEAGRFPALSACVTQSDKDALRSALAEYLCDQTKRGVLRLSDPDHAASVFLQMILGEIYDRWLFRSDACLEELDFPAHMDYVIDVFLRGVAPRDPATSHVQTR